MSKNKPGKKKSSGKSRRKQSKGSGAPEIPIARTPLIDLSPRQQVVVCLVLLVAVTVLFFWPIHFGGKAIVATDTTNYLAGSKAMHDYRAETGRPALWAPNMFSGMPGFLLSYPARVPQIDDVLRVMRRVVWPTSHLIVLLTGTFLLAYRLTRDRWSSLLAGVAYALTTYLPVILMAGHNSKFISLCLVPWLFLAFHYGLEKPRPLAALLFAAITAVNLRAGHIQITYYALFVLLFWWIGAGVTAWRRGALSPYVRSTLLFVLGGVLGLLMAAQPYLATFEYKAYSIRGGTPDGATGGLLWDRAMAWSQGVGEMLTLIVADGYGGAGAEYWGPKTFTGGPHYLSALVVVLAIVGAITVRRTVVTAFAVAAVVMSLFALGENFAVLNRPMFSYFPLFDAFRAPETWLSMVAGVCAVLAAVGLYRALGGNVASADETEEKVFRGDAWKVAKYTFGALAGVLIILLLARDAILSFEKPGEFELFANNVALRQQLSADDPRVVQAVRAYLDDVAGTRSAMFQADAARSLAVLLVGFLALYLVRRGRIGRDLGAVAIALIVFLDLFGVGRRYLNDDVLVDKSAAQQQVPVYDFDNYLVGRVEEAGGPGHFRVLSLEGNPMTNARPSYSYESVGGYHGAKLRNYEEYMVEVLFPRGLGSPELNGLDVLGVRFVVGQAGRDGYAPVYTSEQTGLTVLERIDPVQRARFVGEVVVEDDEQATWALVRAASDVTSLAVVADEPALAIQPVDSTSEVSVELLEYEARDIRWAVSTDAPRLLVTSEIYYPAGWEAEVDGEPAPIVQVNGIVRGVYVPAGDHEVTMSFNPSSDRQGYLIALLSTILVYGGIVLIVGLGFVQRRRESAGEATD